MKKQSIKIKLKVVAADSDDVFGDVARLHLEHRPFAKAGKIIVLTVGENTVRVVARGANSNQKLSIALDSSTRERLKVRANQSFEFQVRKAGFVDEVLWAWTATDAMPRIAVRLSVLSVALGFVGLVLGIISICQ